MSLFRAALAVQVITAFFFGYFHDLLAINGPVEFIIGVNAKSLDNGVENRKRVIHNFTFPYHDNVPFQFLKRFADFNIAGYVSIELLLPIVSVGIRCCRFRAVGVPMPEAAVHKDYGPVFWQHNIGRTG